MTSRDDFPADEWRTLAELPQTISLAVIASGRPNPVELFQELSALSATLQQTVDQRPANTLVNAVAAAGVETLSGGKVPGMPVALGSLPGGDLSTPEGRARMRQRAVEACQRAGAVLNRRSTPDESEGFGRWALAVGRKVAAAAKEGSVMGIGGDQVSPEEQETLEALALALGIAL